VTSSSPASAPEAVVLQKDPRVVADRDLATIEFLLGVTVGAALVFAIVLRAHRALAFRVRG